MFTNWRKWLLIPVLLIGGFFGLRQCDRTKDNSALEERLKPVESEAVIIDPLKHKLTLITKEHTKTFTLPDRPSRISVLKGDGVKIVSPQYGTQFRPGLGVAYSLHGGVILGMLDLAYWKRLDLSMGLAINPKLVQDTGMFVGVSMQTYSNCSVGIGLDNQVRPLMFVRVRL